MKVFVRNKWKKDENGEWYAVMKTVDQEGYNEEKLEPGKEIKFEVTGERRCTGYWNDDREMVPCPGFAKLEKGSKCPRCKRKDIYSNYVEGKGKSPRHNESHSVYLAQIGSKVKVGVARTARLERRWVEQGADYTVELEKDLDSKQALEKEQKISGQGFQERIRKENKIKKLGGSQKLEKALQKLEQEKEIREPQIKTVYPILKQKNLQRKGLFTGSLKAVKGNILCTRNQAVGLTEGKVLDKPSQQGLDKF